MKAMAVSDSTSNRVARRCQTAVPSLGQRNRSQRPLSSFDWNCDNKQCAHQAQSHSELIHHSTGKAVRQRRGSRRSHYDFHVKCLGGGVSTQGWSSSRNVGASKDSLTGSAEGSATSTSAGIRRGTQV